MSSSTDGAGRFSCIIALVFIYNLLAEVYDSQDVLVCRLLRGKVTLTRLPDIRRRRETFFWVWIS
ncbi:MAG TPA: hypothetical protein VNG69_04525 [Casimicrobiaceae bacterium]|nr:hypothetical protein [Casimicrobiaceae bacterium]